MVLVRVMEEEEVNLEELRFGEAASAQEQPQANLRAA